MALQEYLVLHQKQIYKDSTKSFARSVPKEKLSLGSRVCNTWQAVSHLLHKYLQQSLRGLFYVFVALHETASWKPLSNTESIERLGEIPLSIVLCWARRFCGGKCLSVHTVCPSLAIMVVLELHTHIDIQKETLATGYEYFTPIQGLKYRSM